MTDGVLVAGPVVRILMGRIRSARVPLILVLSMIAVSLGAAPAPDAQALVAPSYPAGTGSIPIHEFQTFSITDRASLKVNLATGNLLFTSNDFSSGALGIDRSWNSLSQNGDSASTLGYGWTLNYGDAWLQDCDDTGPQAVMPGDLRFKFTKGSDGTYAAPTGLHDLDLENTGGSGCENHAWTVTDRLSKASIVFDGTMSARRYLTQVTDGSGNRIEVDYDSSSVESVKPLSVSDAMRDRTVTYLHSDDGRRVTGLQDWTGRTATYNHDGDGRLAASTDLVGGVTRYGYDAGNLITSITDPNGTETLIGYDSSRRVTSITRAELTWSFTYDVAAIGDPIMVGTPCADPGGAVSTQVVMPGFPYPSGYCLDGEGRVVAEIRGDWDRLTYDYDANSNVTTAGWLRSQATMVYDDQARLTSATDAVGTQRTFDYDDAANPHLATSVTNPQGNTYGIGYDSSGRTTEITDPAAEAQTYTYNDNGALATSTDQLGRVTAYSYDARGRLTSIEPPGTAAVNDEPAGTGHSGVVRMAGPNRFATAAELSSASVEPGIDVAYVATGTNFADALSGGVAAGLDGAPVLLVAPDALPVETAEELDRLDPGRIVILGGSVAVSEEVAEALAAFTDGPVDRLSGPDRFATAVAVAQATFPDGADTVYIGTGSDFPDALAGVPAAVSAPGPLLLVTDDTVPEVTAGELDRLDPGRIVVLGGTAVVDHSVEDELDAYGDVDRLAGPNRFATAAAIAGSEITAADTVYVATGGDFADALTAGAVAGNDPAPVLLVTSDAIPEETSAALANIGPSRIIVMGGTVAVSGDVEAALAGFVQESDGIAPTVYGYDELDRVTSTTDGTGHETVLGYDAGNRVNLVTYADGSRLSYDYDGVGNLIARYDSVINASTTYTYDALNRLTTETAPGEDTITYGYDSASRMVSYTDGGGTTSYEYGWGSLLTKVTDPAGAVTTYQIETAPGTPESYHPPFPPKIFYPNGVTVTNTPDMAGRLLDTTATDAAGTVLLHRQYIYTTPDTVVQTDLVHTEVDHVADTSTVYTYDALDRLTRARTSDRSSGAVINEYRYTYDAAGNRTTSYGARDGVTVSETSNEVNQLTQRGDTTFAYDRNGNMTASSDGFTGEYNAKNQTTSLTPPDGAAITATYNGAGQSELSHLGSDTLTNSALGITRVGEDRFTRGPDGRLVSMRTAEGTTHHYLTDIRGSVTGLTAADGSLTSFSYNGPAGIAGAQSGDAAALRNPFRFAGELYSPELKLYKMGERWYDPELGRWTQADPLLQPFSPREANRYGYAAADPVNFVDPSGLSALDKAKKDARKARQWAACALTAAALSCGGVVDQAGGHLGSPLGGRGAAMVQREKDRRDREAKAAGVGTAAAVAAFLYGLFGGSRLLGSVEPGPGVGVHASFSGGGGSRRGGFMSGC
ncbi:hypothetical protein BH23ACT9_BH23ACT9_08070 [soil metagenome]